jgi:hypothetical protein
MHDTTPPRPSARPSLPWTRAVLLQTPILSAAVVSRLEPARKTLLPPGRHASDRDTRRIRKARLLALAPLGRPLLRGTVYTGGPWRQAAVECVQFIEPVVVVPRACTASSTPAQR